ncbi:MAG: cation-transporting P-type ATPase, partial [Candidatus Thorarchaeota archaeon]
MRKKTKDKDFQEQKNLIPHSMSIEDIDKELETDLKFGLKSETAKERLALYGENVIPKIKGSIWEVYIAPLLNWLINIYLIVT